MLAGRPLLLLLGALLPAAGLAQVKLEAPAPIVRLLSPYLSAYTAASPGLQADLSEVLATEGYFSPQLEPVGEADSLRLKIDPGPRTVVGAVSVAIDGPLPAERRQQLIADWALAVGQPFRQEDWNNAKQQILSQLLADEYPAARLLNSLADIDSEARQASLSTHYASGPRYRFGELQISGLQRYPPELVARYNRAALPGDPYREADLNTLQSTLQSTPYFTSVRAELDLSASDEDGDGSISAPIILRVRERQPHRIGFGTGISSNTGARVEANYHTPDLFRHAWSLESGLRLEQKKQTLYGDIFLPPDSRNRRHSFGAMSEKTDIEELKTERYAFGVQSVQQRGSIEQRLSLGWQHERREPSGALAVTSRALVPNVQWTWRRVDHPLDPQNGIVLQAQVGGGAKAALSDQNFVRLHGRWQQYVALGASNQLSLRAELGRTFADSRLRIPQDYLFRTGGTGSVRGYGYQSLGIKEGEATVGGRYLAVASAELTHWLNDSWGVAAFVDTGDAVDSLADVRLATGYGLGARWRSPAGPIGVDLAYGERSREVHLHFSLAIPF
ncbi:MAG: outer membrane protein assembly factor [Betaproteobacteria bacterium HGW-Betaproteobacteria-12]|nr:MAG: outer membrane protein assembly factor [Betaproteobacteria bacterium HGW-Betaproteobacteria-12]